MERRWVVGSIQTQSLHFGRISRNFFLFCNAKTDLIRSKNPVAGKFVRHLNSVLFNSLISQSRVLWLIAGMRSSSNFYCCARLITGRAIYYTVVSSREKGRASSSVFHYKFPSHFYSTNRFKLENFSPSPPPLPTPSQFQSNVSEISSIMRHPKFSSFPRSLELFYTINRHQMDAQTGVKKWSPPCHMISLSCACCSFIITDADDGDFGGVAVHKTLIHSVDNGWGLFALH